MLCPRCKNEISEDAQFCSHCGMKIKRCPSCHQPIFENAKYCSYCGTAIHEHSKSTTIGGYYQPLNHENIEFEETNQTSFKDVPTNNKVKLPIIIISVVVLIVATVGSYLYLQKTKNIEIFQDDKIVDKNDENSHQDIKVNGITSDVSLIGNLNQGGHVVLYKDKVYITNDQEQLVCMNKQLKDQKVLVDDKAEYINIVDDIIYYTDAQNQLCSIGIDGKNQKVVVKKKAFYVVVKGQKIYYQSDTDGESIFVYDLKTNKNTQLNKRQSYNLNVVDDKIYYTSTDGIYSIGIDGKGDEKLLSGKSYMMSYYENKLYFSTDDLEMKSYDLKSQKAENVIDEVGQFMNMNKQYIFFYSSKGLMRYDMETTKIETLYNGSIEYCEIIGDKLIITVDQYGSHEEYRCIMEMDGSQQQRLFQNQDGSYV